MCVFLLIFLKVSKLTSRSVLIWKSVIEDFVLGFSPFQSLKSNNSFSLYFCLIHLTHRITLNDSEHRFLYEFSNFSLICICRPEILLLNRNKKRSSWSKLLIDNRCKNRAQTFVIWVKSLKSCVCSNRADKQLRCELCINSFIWKEYKQPSERIDEISLNLVLRHRNFVSNFCCKCINSFLCESPKRKSVIEEIARNNKVYLDNRKRKPGEQHKRKRWRRDLYLRRQNGISFSFSLWNNDEELS